MTTQQLDLLLYPPIFGQAAANILLTPSDRERMARQGMRTIHIAQYPGCVYMTWSGTGPQPHWIKEWLAGGGTLQQLIANIE